MALEPKPSQNKYSELLEKLSPELLKILLSEETPPKISAICFKNGVEEEEKIEAIAHQVGQVLLGSLSPKEFRAVLEKEVKLDSLTATQVTQEINNVIFLPVKSSLERIYEIKIAPPVKPEVVPPPKEKPPAPPRKDIYREPTE